MGDTRPLDQQTVTVRVQVIDMQSFILDLTVPTYLPAKDLTQRIARDAGLDAYQEGAQRRNFWMRARGRLVLEDETLADLGVVNGELVYLLPEPPAGGGVSEQVPDYPDNRGYASKGNGALFGALMGLLAWAILWGSTLTVQRDLWTVLLPGLAMGFICTSLSRHMWGGHGSQTRIVGVALGLFVLMFVVVFLPAIYQGEQAAVVYSESILGLVTGFVGVILGWVGWWGAVEPLPERDITEQRLDQQQLDLEEVPCGICGQGVSVDVREECPYRCGRAFHSGCFQAKVAVFRGDSRYCAVCNALVG